MTKDTMLEEIQKRLPNGVFIKDETNKYELTEDEYVGILSWIKYFNKHYKEYGKTKHPVVKFPVISKRISLDLDLYTYDGEESICINISKRKDGGIRELSIKKIISKYRL